MTIEVGHEGLRAAGSAFATIGTDLDGACASIPASVGTGDAAPLLADVLTAVSGTVAFLVHEADLIRRRLHECEQAYTSTDAASSAHLSSLFRAGG